MKTRTGLRNFSFTFLSVCALILFASCASPTSSDNTSTTTNTTTTTDTVKYTVTYYGNGNTGGSVPVDSTSYEGNSYFTAKTPDSTFVKTGYSFDSWNTSSDGSGDTYYEGYSRMITKNLTLYAIWTETTLEAPTLTLPYTFINSVHVHWTTVTGASKYQLTRIVGTTTTVIATITGNDYLDTGLTAGTSYGYVIKAVSSSGTTGKGRSLTTTTKTTSVFYGLTKSAAIDMTSSTSLTNTFADPKTYPSIWMKVAPTARQDSAYNKVHFIYSSMGTLSGYVTVKIYEGSSLLGTFTNVTEGTDCYVTGISDTETYYVCTTWAGTGLELDTCTIARKFTK